jgi:hypothetical protein
MITLGFPPYFPFLASMSPKVLETERRPGKTLKGPKINCSWIYEGAFAAGILAIV